MVPTTAFGGTFGAAGLAFGIASTAGDFVALVDAGALAVLRFAGTFARSGARAATAGAFLSVGVFATAGVVGFAAFAKTRAAGAGAVFFTATAATSAVFLTVLSAAGFFTATGAAAACFSGTGLRALLDAAFALAAGALGEEACVVKALEAVDFAVFFVVNL